MPRNGAAFAENGVRAQAACGALPQGGGQPLVGRGDGPLGPFALKTDTHLSRGLRLPEPSAGGAGRRSRQPAVAIAIMAGTEPSLGVLARCRW